MAIVAIIQPLEPPPRLGRRAFDRIRARLYLLGFGLAMAAVRLPGRRPDSGARDARGEAPGARLRPDQDGAGTLPPWARPVTAAAPAAPAARRPRNAAAAGSAIRRGPVHPLSR